MVSNTKYQSSEIKINESEFEFGQDKRSAMAPKESASVERGPQ